MIDFYTNTCYHRVVKNVFRYLIKMSMAGTKGTNKIVKVEGGSRPPSASIFSESYNIITDTNRNFSYRFADLFRSRISIAIKTIYGIDINDDWSVDKITALYFLCPNKFMSLAVSTTLIALDCLSLSFVAALKKLSDKTDNIIASFLLNVIGDLTGEFVLMVHAISSIAQSILFAIASPYGYVISPLIESLEKNFNIPKKISIAGLVLLSAGVAGAMFIELAPLVQLGSTVFTAQNMAVISNSTAVAFFLYCMRYWSNNDINNQISQFEDVTITPFNKTGNGEVCSPTDEHEVPLSGLFAAPV